MGGERTFLSIWTRLLAVWLVFCVNSPVIAADERFSLGWQAYQSGNYPVAVQFWSELADQGDPEAQLNLGLLHDAGQGVAADPVRAVYWYRKAAEHGNAAAQYNLGLMYRAGRGVPRDAELAQRWLEQAAGQGLQEASALLPAPEAARQGGTPEAFIDSIRGASTGTAWLVAGRYAVTANHVVAGGTAVALYDSRGQRHTASVIARDAGSDLAVLQLEGEAAQLPYLPLSATPLRTGSDVFTLGFPRVDILGRTPKLTDGIISSANGFRDDPGSYQTSVQIQPGNSGGPLLNMQGAVVGVISSMLGSFSEHADPVLVPNVSYAVKVRVLEDLLRVLPDAHATHAADGATLSLADLAERIQSSVLLVVASN